MSLSFANIPLIVPVEHEGLSETQSFLNKEYRPGEVAAHDFLPWQGQHGRPWNGLWGCQPGTLVWPTGASRWAEGTFFAGKDEADEITALTAGKNSQSLAMDDGTGGTLSATMFALPPRPISQFDLGDNGDHTEPLYLIHLVDQRYWWQGARYGGSSIRASQVKSASDLVTALGRLLNVTINKDIFSSDNLVVPVGTDLRVKSAAGLLDMVAQSLGLRVVCGLDGTVSLMSFANASVKATANLSAGIMFLGGQFQWGTGCVDANKAVLDYLPSSIDVNFPKTVGASGGQRTVQGEPYYTKNVPITLSGQSGRSTPYDLMVLEEARYKKAGDSDPDNKSTIDGYAQTYVQNWYNWQTGSISRIDSGITPAQPDGLHRIEWRYALEPSGCTTRFIRETYDVVPWWTSPNSATSGSGTSGTIIYTAGTPSNFKAFVDDPVTVPAGNTVVIPLDFVLYDTDDYVASDRATMPKAAKYHFDYEVHGDVTFNDDDQHAPECIEAYLRINGTVEMEGTHSCYTVAQLVYEEWPDPNDNSPSTGSSGGSEGEAAFTCVCLGRSTDHNLHGGDYVELVVHNPSDVDLVIGISNASLNGHMIDDVLP